MSASSPPAYSTHPGRASAPPVTPNTPSDTYSSTGYQPGRSSAPLVTPNTPGSDTYSSLGYTPGRSSVPIMYQNAYYSSDTNTSVSSAASYGRLSAPVISPEVELPPRSVAATPGQESLSLSGLEGDVHMAFSEPSPSSSAANNVRNLRNDLLSAADSITGAMSSLVKELSSGRNIPHSFNVW